MVGNKNNDEESRKENENLQAQVKDLVLLFENSQMVKNPSTCCLDNKNNHLTNMVLGVLKVMNHTVKTQCSC